MIPLPSQTQTLHSELVERLVADSTRKSVSKAPGTFTSKEIRGETYVYFQYSEPGGKHRQLYLGRTSPEIERLMKRYREERPDELKTRAELEQLSAQALLGGAFSMGASPARVLESFSSAGLFDAGTVLVGTHAFGLLGNMLGVRWAGAHLRTDDIDLAGISLAASDDRIVDAPKALERLKMGFLPVPALDPKHPSTSFKVRGSSLRVDFLTPGKEGKPVPLPRLATCAQPLPYLDYLIENPERTAVLDNGGFLVLIPSPGRFALHKIIIAGQRGAAQHSKSGKDLAQAAELIAFLQRSRPGELRLAAREIRRRKWESKLSKAWKSLVLRHPAAEEAARLILS